MIDALALLITLPLFSPRHVIRREADASLPRLMPAYALF